MIGSWTSDSGVTGINIVEENGYAGDLCSLIPTTPVE